MRLEVHRNVCTIYVFLFSVQDDDNNSASVRFELEGFTPCSKSHLWKLMMSFYERKGPESWSQGIVPHFITCNSFIGRSYAKVCILVYTFTF